VRVELTVPPDPRNTLVELSDALNPLEDESVREIVPAKPFIEVKITFETPIRLGLVLMLAGLALILKSGKAKVTVVECDRLPLLPVTTTEYAPEPPEHERVEF